MIIACERCKTRFNVPDDKLGAGPVRMRCSKCDHTFVATAAAAVPAIPTVTATASLPPTATQSMTPVGPPRAPTPGPLAPNPFGGLPSTHPTEAFGAIPASTAPFGPAAFAAPRPPTPRPSAPGSTAIFGAAPMPVTGVVGPFAGGPPRPAPDPFAGLAAPQGTAPDPFAALAAGPAKPVDPFAALAPPAAAPDPFASLTPAAAAAPARAPDPFAALGSSAAALASDPFAASTPAAPDPFAAKPSFGDLFGPSPTSPAAPPARPAPPAAAPSPFGPMATSDPFAAPPPPPSSSPPAMAAPFGDADPFADPPPGPPSLPSRDPFGDDDDDNAPGDSVDDARAALFGISAPAPSPFPAGPPPMPTTASSGLELAAPAPPPAPAVAARPSSPSRLISGIAAALQVVLLVGFTVIAVVVGRGGSIPALLTGDVAAALAMPAVPDTGLVVDDVIVARRETATGLAVLVISGVVHHRGTAPLPAVVVEAVVGDVTARGQAWTAVTPAAIDAARAAEDLAVLQAMRSSSPTVSPGDRAPFVIVMAAPEGIARPRLAARHAD